MIIRSKAPLRLSFAGGGTDVSPYVEERGGVVLSVTIDKYAYGSLRLRDDRNITVQSLDYDIVAKYHVDDELKYDGELDLVKAVIKNMCNGNEQGLDFFLHSDAPPGSGLGSSSTMVVALIGLLKHWQRLPLTNYEIAELAYHIERKDLGIRPSLGALTLSSLAPRPSLSTHCALTRRSSMNFSTTCYCVTQGGPACRLILSPPRSITTYGARQKSSTRWMN